MAIPAYRRASNLRRSIHTWIGTSLSVDTHDRAGAALSLTVPVSLDYQWFDPEGLGDPLVDPPRAWMNLTWLEEGAGRGGISVFQVDVRVRIGAQNDPDGDPFGVIADDVADAFEGIFSGVWQDGPRVGRLRAYVPVLDFSDPTDPVDAGGCIFVQDPSSPGSWGQPVERRTIPSVDGYRRITLRYACRFVDDAIPGNVYMDG